jgi:beta-galactosidase beta subunit
MNRMLGSQLKVERLRIFFPEDAHMPLISSWQIHKVVVKIAASPI